MKKYFFILCTTISLAMTKQSIGMRREHRQHRENITNHIEILDQQLTNALSSLPHAKCCEKAISSLFWMSDPANKYPPELHMWWPTAEDRRKAQDKLMKSCYKLIKLLFSCKKYPQKT
ncbi:hypothetical protein ACFLYA_01635 [Candidatus Dependentiae bacterium]